MKKFLKLYRNAKTSASPVAENALKRSRFSARRRQMFSAFGITALLLAALFILSGSGIPVPTASGTSTNRNNKAEIDYSNANSGYVMVRFLDSRATAVRVIVAGPNSSQYHYQLNTGGTWEVFSFSEGNGEYTVSVFEQISGNRYSLANRQTISVTLTNAFAPFLLPNQFVNFNRNSRTVTIAADLVRGKNNVIEKVGAVYNYVIENMTYDTELAATVTSGYVPNIDQALAQGRGICFDYAAIMTAMLRSQEIPTKLVIGYVGDVYHAWISVYSAETGWVNDIIWFDGTDWRIMDPTFASNGNQSNDIMRFIGDGNNHNPTHTH
ncbi:MAG: transglutaminase domain-containing protein [Clostridiales bacterium]|nr:transglutaminase domain-containing protein [Clostridiales bacterium]